MTRRHIVALVLAVIFAVALTMAIFGPSASDAARRLLVTSRDIKDGSIKVRDLAPGARPRPGLRGPQGPAGPAGATGAQGPAGSSAALVLTTRTDFFLVGPSSTSSGTVSCAAGERVVGGGVDAGSGLVQASRPSGLSGWSAKVVNENPSLPASVSLYAICLGP